MKQEIKRNIIKVCNEAATKAMELLNHNFKNGNKVDIDIRVEDIYLKELKDKLSNFILLSEESGLSRVGTEEEFTVILDPLDGTGNYMNGIPIFATSVSVFENTDINHFGMNKLVYSCVRTSIGKNIEFERTAEKITSKFKVENKVDKIENSFLRYSHIRSPKTLIDKINHFRLLGASVVELVLLLEGSFDGFVDFGTLKITDIASVYPLLGTIGFKITEPNGLSFKECNIIDNPKIGLIAANEKLFGDIMEVLDSEL